ncbi:hypothetical protein BCR36DRAFT_95260 [Piromyces finnis]|uniref:Uncharacterized protein n=1 Tax=Piromyces finnis TaxID=1754191 RepID=A0A1Y1V4L2_9FUNG|nr:hypothetical protein BCR36DRAFT_95260 [Piromyces finnis]|eukprot:ORX47288.1 hypothetical protein BCR36DRAFT_95260 [Piromyces finnis]
MKKTTKYIYKINLVTGEKEIVGMQQNEKPIQQTLQEPISIIKEEMIDVPSEIGKKTFVKRIIKYLIVVDPIKGTKKVVNKHISEEPIEDLKDLNEISLSNLVNEGVITNDEDEYNEGKSIIGKLQNLTKSEERIINLDDTLEDDSYSGKDLIDQIKNALVFEDHETKEISDMDIHINSSFNNYSHSLSEDQLTENKKNLIFKNYKEYEDFVDNEDLNIVNEKREEDIENQFLKRKSEEKYNIKRIDVLQQHLDIQPEISKEKMKVEEKTEKIENSNCCTIKSSCFKKDKENENKTKTKENEVINSYKRSMGSQKESKPEVDDEYDLYSIETTTVVSVPVIESRLSYFDNFDNNKSNKSSKNKDCIIM